ncbi:MAG: hypothetical protein WC208_12805 [Gallionella sp.]|jgi:hypothetical protein
MTTITFDTHKFVKDLESAGVPALQAEAFVRAQQEILSQTLDSTLATRPDIKRVERVKHKLIEFEGEFKAIKWMLGIIVGSVVMLVLRAFFPV